MLVNGICTDSSVTPTFYFKAHDLKTSVQVSTSDNSQIFPETSESPPNGISLEPTSALGVTTGYNIVANNVAVADQETPFTYFINFTARADSSSSAKYFVGVLVVIDPSTDTKPPTITVNTTSVAVGNAVEVTVADPHSDCYVHESANDIRAGNLNQISITIAGISFSLNRDETASSQFRGPIIIPETLGPGQYSIVYDGYSHDSQCVSESNFGAKQTLRIVVTQQSLHFNRPSYSVDDANPNGVTLSLSSLTTDTVLLRAPGFYKLVPLSTLSNNFGVVSSQADSAADFFHSLDVSKGPVTVSATLISNTKVYTTAVVMRGETLKFVIPNGNYYFSNETASLQLVDPRYNTDANKIDNVNVTICSYADTAQSGTLVLLPGYSQARVQLLETGYNTAEFVNPYYIDFVNNTISPSSAGASEGLFSQGHVGMFMETASKIPTILVAKVEPPGQDSALSCDQGFSQQYQPAGYPTATVWQVPPTPTVGTGSGENYGAENHVDPINHPFNQIVCGGNLGSDSGDGICTGWKSKGYLSIQYPATTGSWYNWPSVSVGTKHHDIILELDYVDNSQNGYCGSADKVNWQATSTTTTNLINAFKNAPIHNNDGTTGIDLRIMSNSENVANQTSCLTQVWTWYDPNHKTDSFDTIKDAHFGDSSGLGSNKGAALAQVEHYGLMIPKQAQDPGSSGVSEQIGNDFVVSLGAAGFHNSVADQQGTIMHELGHNLGLYHGGPNVQGNDYTDNCKPNYYSVMSYLMQTPEAYSNATLHYSDDIMTSADPVWSSPWIDTNAPSETGNTGNSHSGYLELSNSSLNRIQFVWGLNDGAVISPPANISKSWTKIDWNNDGNPTNGGSMPPPEPYQIFNFGTHIPGCGANNPAVTHISGAVDWGNLIYNGRETNWNNWKSGKHSNALLELNTTGVLELRAASATTTNIMAQQLIADNHYTNTLCNVTTLRFPNISQYSPGGSLDFTINAPSYNLKSAAFDNITMSATSSADHNTLPIVTQETGPDTSNFIGHIPTSPAPQLNRLEVIPDTELSIQFPFKCGIFSTNAPVTITFALEKTGNQWYVVEKGNQATGGISQPATSFTLKTGFAGTLIENTSSVRNLLLDKVNNLNDTQSILKAIANLTALRSTMDCSFGGSCSNDLFNDSRQTRSLLYFVTSEIVALSETLNIPFEGPNSFTMTTNDANCDNGGTSRPCTIRGTAEAVMPASDTFKAEPNRSVTVDLMGQGNVTLLIPSAILPSVNTVRSEFACENFPFMSSTSAGTTTLTFNSPQDARRVGIFSGAPDIAEVNDPSVKDDGGNQKEINTALTKLDCPASDQNYTLIVEVDNASGYTTQIDWQKGTVFDDGISRTMGSSWAADPGDYTIRVIALSSLDSPVLLAQVKSKHIHVD